MVNTRNKIPPILYEDEKDRSNQSNLISFFMNYTNCSSFDCPPNYPLDYLFKRDGKTVAMVECRKRDHNFGFYPSVFCSMKKVNFAIDVIKNYDIPVVFLVEWKDGTIGIVDFDEDRYLDFQYKNFRNDPYDCEPGVHYNIDKFRILRNAH